MVTVKHTIKTGYYSELNYGNSDLLKVSMLKVMTIDDSHFSDANPSYDRVERSITYCI